MANAALSLASVVHAARSMPREQAHEWTREHVLGEALFKDALLRETRRGDRGSRPCVALVVDAGAGSQSLEPAAWVSIIRAMETVKRDYDVIGWLEPGSLLGLLVPEVKAVGMACELTQRVRLAIADALGERALATLSIRMYAHGGEPGLDSNIPSIGVLLEAFIEARQRNGYDLAKRCLDVLGSLIVLLLIAPVLAAIVVAVTWTSPGPALFTQLRIGRKGKPFTILKFRTMYVDAGHAIHNDYVTWFITSSGQQGRQGDEVFKITNDPRITRVGSFLRKTSLDELPQFWNVLRGDMSLVGPRPPLPFEVEQYQPWHRRRVLEAAPGITGLWQVMGRSRTTFDEMVRLDLRYARKRSLWTDLKILAATPRAVVSGKGAH